MTTSEVQSANKYKCNIIFVVSWLEYLVVCKRDELHLAIGWSWDTQGIIFINKVHLDAYELNG